MLRTTREYAEFQLLWEDSDGVAFVPYAPGETNGSGEGSVGGLQSPSHPRVSEAERDRLVEWVGACPFARSEALALGYFVACCVFPHLAPYCLHDLQRIILL